MKYTRLLTALILASSLLTSTANAQVATSPTPVIKADEPTAEQLELERKALALLDEFENLIDLFRGRQLLAHRFDRLLGIVFAAVDEAERFLDLLHAFGWEVISLQADEINAADHCWVPIRDHEGRDGVAARPRPAR